MLRTVALFDRFFSFHEAWLKSKKAPHVSLSLKLMRFHEDFDSFQMSPMVVTIIPQ